MLCNRISVHHICLTTQGLQSLHHDLHVNIKSWVRKLSKDVLNNLSSKLFTNLKKFLPKFSFTLLGDNYEHKQEPCIAPVSLLCITKNLTLYYPTRARAL